MSRGSLAVVVALVLASGCSLRQAGINRMAAALAASSSVYDADNDPEFVRAAAPSTLKTIEMLLSQAPQHEGLLLTACSGFTQYSYGFLHVESAIQRTNASGARELRQRAGRMYQRARGYCLRGLAVRHPEITADALRGGSDVLSRTTSRDVPFLYWAAASWGADLSLADDQVKRIGELTAIRALLTRARTLDETWDHGAIHEALIAVDGLPPLVGGSRAAARADFDRAVALSQGRSVFAYLAFALTLPEGSERTAMLERAAAIDVQQSPSRRLTNLIAQRYAKALLGAAR
ncbi:MAG: hypothetical protein HOQ29_18100 [Acidobacteria bacterium]|nr:hypothetical protein [Acidobacteriota bacterium]